jgi:RNA polymerase sigma-70 factor, ECF subfamily
MDSKLTSSELKELLATGYRYACALRVNPSDAEDLVQEAWMKVVRAYGTEINQAVLLRAIRNLHIDKYRHAKRFQHIPIDDEMPLVDSTAELDVLNVGDPQLNRCLSKLRAPEREALFLTVVEGYTAEEVAKLTQSPRGTVLSLVHRARMKMRNFLADENDRNSNLVALKKNR